VVARGGCYALRFRRKGPLIGCVSPIARGRTVDSSQVRLELQLPYDLRAIEMTFLNYEKLRWGEKQYATGRDGGVR